MINIRANLNKICLPVTDLLYMLSAVHERRSFEPGNKEDAKA